MAVPEIGSVKQTLVIAKNAMVKFAASRKLYKYVAVAAAFLCVMTLFPRILGSSLAETGWTADYLFSFLYVDFMGGAIGFGAFGNVQLLALIAAAMFGSKVLSTEFQDRTGLILFTRPVRRVSIFVGKLIACLIVEGAVIVAYYLAAVLILHLAVGGAVSSFLPSLAMALAYMFACTGFAMLFSALFKKGRSSEIFAILVVLLLFPATGWLLGVYGMESWFMLDRAADAVAQTLPGYAEYMGTALMTDVTEPGLIMLGWGALTCLLAYVVFARRQF